MSTSRLFGIVVALALVVVAVLTIRAGITTSQIVSSTNSAISEQAWLEYRRGEWNAGTAYSNAASTKPEHQDSHNQIEPRAGQWQTWVIASGSQMRLPAPPDRAATQDEIKQLKDLAAQRDAAARDLVAYWSAGSPSYRWVQLALAQIHQNYASPRSARAVSLLNVAIYDAMVAAWDSKYAYNRPRPSEFDESLTTLIANPNSPSYPSEQAVAAGAASTILAYLYPADAQVFTDKAAEAGRSQLLAGVQYPSDVQAGLDLGRAVAQKVIERAKTDGSDVKWTGTVPTGPGLWNGTNPVEPLFGTWKPWVLTSGSQLRPPAPPAYNSPQEQAELAEIKTFTRTFDTNQKAFFWQSQDGLYNFWYDDISLRLFEHHLDTNPPRAARAYALASVSQYDAMLACWDAKYTYWAIRPFQLDPTLVTLFPTPNHPSYPAAHGCRSGGIAAIIEYLFPAEASYIHAKADEAANSRIWAGIHFRSDIETGLALGRAVAQLVIERAKQDGADSGAH